MKMTTHHPVLTLELLGPHPEIAALPYTNAAPGGRGAYQARLPIYEARANALPPDIDAIVFASDLQGRCFDPVTGTMELLGIGLADHLRAASERGMSRQFPSRPHVLPVYTPIPARWFLPSWCAPG